MNELFTHSTALKLVHCPHRLEAGDFNTLPIDVCGCTVANNVFIYLSKLAMELILIAIGPLRNCSSA